MTEGHIKSAIVPASSGFGKAEVIAKVSQAAFGKPLITNVLRGHVVEAIIALALEPEWRWCGADYGSWDFERGDGVRLEVKQSAARQSWTSDKPSRPAFDVAERTGRYEGAEWVAEAGRAAHLYVFAHHPIYDDRADHRDPDQWQFYVVAARDLPNVKQLGLGRISELTSAVSVIGLADKVRVTAPALVG